MLKENGDRLMEVAGRLCVEMDSFGSCSEVTFNKLVTALARYQRARLDLEQA